MSSNLNIDDLIKDVDEQIRENMSYVKNIKYAVTKMSSSVVKNEMQKDTKKTFEKAINDLTCCENQLENYASNKISLKIVDSIIDDVCEYLFDEMICDVTK